MANMMQNDDFLRSMSDMMQRPEVVDQVSFHVRSVCTSSWSDSRLEPSAGTYGATNPTDAQ